MGERIKDSRTRAHRANREHLRLLVLDALELGGCTFVGLVESRHRPLANALDQLERACVRGGRR